MNANRRQLFHLAAATAALGWSRVSLAAEGEVRIAADFPGGNIKVEKIDGETIHVAPDLRDTQKGQWWFYWCFRLRAPAGKSVRKADLLTTVETTEQALEASELFFQYYRENANYLERTYDFVERLGIEKVRKDTIYAPDAVRAGLRDRFAKSKSRAHDAWLEGQAPTDPTQFAPLQVLDNKVLA